MQQRVSWPELGSSTTSLQCCVNFTGFRSTSESHSSYSDDHLQVPPWSGAVILGRCVPVSSVVGRWQLRSANSGALVVPRTRTTISRRNFAVAVPATWKSLPVDLRTSPLSRDTLICGKKTKTPFIWLRALLRSSLIGRYTNWHIHSLTHSYNSIRTYAETQITKHKDRPTNR